MSIYAISDLHLSLGVKDKPMNIFGDVWEGYEEKLRKNWNDKVGQNDTVIIAGDISWATYLSEALEDFKFIDALNGRKIILKGNHDYWWETVTKMNNFFDENNIKTITFLYNNCIEVEDYIICGTRYYGKDEDDKDSEKIFKREIQRALISLEAAKALNSYKNVVFTSHYPPDERLLSEIKNYPVKIWIYGHIHSKYNEIVLESDKLCENTGIKPLLTSADYLKFEPIII